MACAAHEIGQPATGFGSGLHRAVVIADRGDRAFVVAVDFPAPPVPGDRFVLAGLTWVVTHARTLQRGAVARPLPPVVVPTPGGQ